MRTIKKALVKIVITMHGECRMYFIFVKQSAYPITKVLNAVNLFINKK